jgi:hypothetical protein
MDPHTLAYLAGHSDFGTTRRYAHPQARTIRDVMARTFYNLRGLLVIARQAIRDKIIEVCDTCKTKILMKPESSNAFTMSR